MGALQKTEADLASATDSRHTRDFENRAAMLRQKVVSPTALLLMRDAQHALSGHDFHAAETSMDDALVLQPEAVALWVARARVRDDAGDYGGAIADLAVAVQRDPGDVEAWEMLSAVERERHASGAAYDAYEHVLTLDPLVADGLKHRAELRRERDGHPV